MKSQKRIIVPGIILLICLVFISQVFAKGGEVTEVYGKVILVDSNNNYLNIESAGEKIAVLVTPSTKIKYDGKTIAIKDLTVGDVLKVEGFYVDKSIMANEVKVMEKAVLQKREIYAVFHDASKKLMPGETLKVTIIGTTGGSASFDIKNLVNGIYMKEVSEGKYEGEYKVQSGNYVEKAVITGNITWPEGTKKSQSASDTVSIGDPSSTLKTSQILPEEDSSTDNRKPNILIIIDNNTKGIIPQTAKLKVNGKDITSKASINEYVISYLPSSKLPNGENTVIFTAIDYNGKEVYKEWSFSVGAAQGEGPAIYNLTHNANNIVLNPGDKLIVTMTGNGSGTATFDIVNFKYGIAMAEKKNNPGVYTGEYTVSKDDYVENAAIIGHLKKSGQETSFQAGYNVSFAYASISTPPVLSAPQITSPQNGETLHTPFNIKGVTIPGYTVEIVITSKSSLFGVINVESDPVVRTATADGSGNFAVSFDSLMSSSGTEYTIKAVSISPSGERSGETVIIVREK